MTDTTSHTSQDASTPADALASDGPASAEASTADGPVSADAPAADGPATAEASTAGGPGQPPSAASDSPGASEPPSRGGAGSTALGVLGFVAALGVGFFAGKWITRPDTPVEIVEGDRVRVALRGDEPQRGPDDAWVTVIEFADFECPYCAKGAGPLGEALDDLGDDARLIFKHYPLPFHSRAMPAARAAYAAQQMGKFWELHDWLYERRGDVGDLRGHVASLGLDPDAFMKVMFSDEAATAIDDDMLAGGKAGVSGTPAYVVNGHLYRGAKSEEQWRAILEAERDAAKKTGASRENVYATLMKDAKDQLGDGKPVGGKKPSANAPKRRPGEADASVRYKVPTAGRPALGADEPLVTVVVFSDFQCPFCKRLAPVVHDVVKNNPDVRVVFRQMPLPSHTQARQAAKAALAAHRQGKFWEMHDKLFAVQSALGQGTFRQLAQDLGLDMARFEKDLADPELDALIDQDMALAKQVGVVATPSSFVNGRYVRGAQTSTSLQSVIEQAREEAQALVDEGTPRAQVYDKLQEHALPGVQAGEGAP